MQLSPDPSKAFTIKLAVTVSTGVPVPVSTTAWGPVAVKVLIWLNEIPLTVLVANPVRAGYFNINGYGYCIALVRAVSATYLPDTIAPVQFPPLPNEYVAKTAGV